MDKRTLDICLLALLVGTYMEAYLMVNQQPTHLDDVSHLLVLFLEGVA